MWYGSYSDDDHNDVLQWVSKIRSAHKDPLKYSYHQSVTENLDIPIFEQLWECLFYVKQIICVEIPSETSVNRDIMKMWNSALPAPANEMCNHWFIWCNDLLIESLQSLIPFTIPHTAWESIVFHLSTDSTSKTRTLLTQIGTISKDKQAQIAERFLIRECILNSVDLIQFNRMFYNLQSDLNIMDKIKQKLALYLNEYNSSMERFKCFLDSSEPSSKCINHSVRNQFSLFLSDVADRVPGITLEDESDMFKMVGSSAGNQNGSTHFTMFIADCEQSGKEDWEDLYHLLCIDKDRIEYEDDAGFRSIFVSGALHSDEPPHMFSCEGLVAGIAFKDGKRKTLTVWDVSDEGPFKEQGKDIFSSDFDVMTHSWKESDPWFNSSFFLNDHVSIFGLAKFDKTIKLMFSIVPFCPEASGRSPSCMIAEYDLGEFSSKVSIFKPKLQQSYFRNAVPLGIHKNMAFVMHLETNMLYVYDIKQADEVVISKTSFECGKDWKIQFNSNPDTKSCLLYKDNYLQIRELDDELSLVNELTLDLNHFSQLYNCFEFQFCDSILYGFLNHQENLHKTPNKFLDSEDDDFLIERFADAHTVHFIVDLDSDDKELIYLDFDDNNRSNSSSFTFTASVLNYASVCIQFCLTGFNRRQELVQLSMTLDVEEELHFEGSKISALCSYFDFATVKFYESFEDMTNTMLPDVEAVIAKQENEVAECEAKKKREQKRLEMLPKLKEHIASGTVFMSTISTWCGHYGFSTVDVEEGKKIDVFVHESCIVNNDRINVRTGSVIQFQLTWKDQSHPRPKAVNVKLLKKVCKDTKEQERRKRARIAKEEQSRQQKWQKRM